jgi:hypothetical protein
MNTEVERYLTELPEVSYAAVKAVADAAATTPVTDDGDDGVMPSELRSWLVRLRLLDGVPFANLVADTELLPPESIRWFYLDRRWTDAVVQGALSVGTVNSDDRTELTARYPQVRDELDREERNVRRRPGSARVGGAVEAISGFLLRSKAVSGWPGLHVRAYSCDPAEGDGAYYPEDHESRMRLLRLERLAPAVLLVLFDGIPTVVHVEEPRHGIQFGFRRPPGPANAPLTLEFQARNRDTFADLPGAPITVPYRTGGAPGVVHLHALRKTLGARAGTGGDPNAPDGGIDSAEYALQLVRYPFRQAYGEVGNVPIKTVFAPTISYATLLKTFTAMEADHG